MFTNTRTSWLTKHRTATEFNIDFYNSLPKNTVISCSSGMRINPCINGEEQILLYLQVSNRYFLISENCTWELIIAPQKSWWSSLKRLPQTVTNFLTALTLRTKRALSLK